MNVNIIFKGFVTYNLDALSSLLCCAGVLDDDSAFELMLKTYLRMTMMKLLLLRTLIGILADYHDGGVEVRWVSKLDLNSLNFSEIAGSVKLVLNFHFD